MRNIIFCFSGTGNSLHLSNEIAKAVGDCEIVLVDKNTKPELECEYDRVGFVYPTYFVGIPFMLKKLIEGMDFSKSMNSYFFAVTTYGGTLGNGVKLLKEIMEKRSIQLSYGEKLKMHSNYLIMYKMAENIAEETQQSNTEMQPIIHNILDKKINIVGNPNFLLKKYYLWQEKKLPLVAKDFWVNDSCVSCGICAKICPTGNIELVKETPVFGSKCEQCLACIQLCPQLAINYKQKTQQRGRYHHPDISVKDLTRNV